MTKHVLISYRWERDRPEEKWLFWLKKKLEEKAFHVTMSELRDLPQGRDWVQDIQTVYGINDSRVLKVPHDPGCLTILSYLESVAKRDTEETVLLVASIGETSSHSTAPEKENVLKLESTKKVGFFKRALGYGGQSTDTTDTSDSSGTKLVVLYSSLGPLLSPQESYKQLSSK
ncbi:MAG: alpha/beta hydrolase [Patescibacteria group bacterium]